LSSKEFEPSRSTPLWPALTIESDRSEMAMFAYLGVRTVTTVTITCDSHPKTSGATSHIDLP
jgi:hypothetical protein